MHLQHEAVGTRPVCGPRHLGRSGRLAWQRIRRKTLPDLLQDWGTVLPQEGQTQQVLTLPLTCTFETTV